MTLEIADPPATENRLAAVFEATTDTKGRCNIPINLSNWSDLALNLQPDLLWFHQHVIDRKMSLEQAGKAVGYHANNVYQVLRGRYEGNYEKFCSGIRSYRKIAEGRAKIQNAHFAHNRNTRLIFNVLTYAQTSNTIVLVSGETGMSKTMGVEAWRAENNHGRTVVTTATEIEVLRGSVMELAGKVGVDKNGTLVEMRDGIHEAFNEHRMLIVDEAQNLIPKDRASKPVALEFFRRLHDATKCGLAFVASARFRTEMAKLHFHFEQVMGRMPVQAILYPDLDATDIDPILDQYFDKISDRIRETCLLIANNKMPEFPGRLRTMVEILRLTSKIAAKDDSGPNEKFFLKSVAMLTDLRGFTQSPKR
jgi:DNA transposition AAA+ family ATPase